MPEKEGASIRTHSLVSSQEIAVCRQGNGPKTRVLICSYVRVFRNFILACTGQKQTFPVSWKLQFFGKTNLPFSFGGIKIKPDAGFSEQLPGSFGMILSRQTCWMSPPPAERLPFQTLPWIC